MSRFTQSIMVYCDIRNDVVGLRYIDKKTSCQPNLVDNLAFWLCSGVRPQKDPSEKKPVMWADLSDYA